MTVIKSDIHNYKIMNLFKVTTLTSVYNGYAELNAARSRSLIKSGIAPLPVLKYIDLKSNDKSSS